MVPYINFPYAEHILKSMGQDPNAKAAPEDIDMLINAARKCQEIASSLEKEETIKGYLIYQEKPPEKPKQLPVEAAKDGSEQ
jgi:hypothetical protein